MGMEQCIGEAIGMPEILALVQKMSHRMIFWQTAKCRAEILQFLIGRTNSQQTAIRLQHIDPSSSIACVNHDLHHSARLEDIAEGLQAEVWISKVMQDPRANDLIESFSQRLNIQDREIVE